MNSSSGKITVNKLQYIKKPKTILPVERIGSKPAASGDKQFDSYTGVDFMIIFPILITLSAVFWIYYKVAILKTRDGLTQRYFNAKSRVCLGSFLIFFAINEYLFYQSQIALWIGLIFLVLGILQLNTGLKEVKHYRNEWKRLNPTEADQ